MSKKIVYPLPLHIAQMKKRDKTKFFDPTLFSMEIHCHRAFTPLLVTSYMDVPIIYVMFWLEIRYVALCMAHAVNTSKVSVFLLDPFGYYPVWFVLACHHITLFRPTKNGWIRP